MTKQSDITFKLLNVLAWCIFIGLCIKAGAFIFNTLFVLLYNPAGATKFYQSQGTDINLASLYNYSQLRFVTVTSLMIIIAVLKATLFYLIVNLFHKKKLNLSHPFNEFVGGYLFKIAYLAIGIALFCFWGANVIFGIEKLKIAIPPIQIFGFNAAVEWLFMGMILLIFAKIFKKGIELQSENDLTV